LRAPHGTDSLKFPPEQSLERKSGVGLACREDRFRADIRSSEDAEDVTALRQLGARYMCQVMAQRVLIRVVPRLIRPFPGGAAFFALSG
jgi:hypothetical protein